MTTYFACPVCEQGDVQVFRVKATAEHLQLCDECDAVWPPGVERTTGNYTPLHAFMEERGLPPLWNQLEKSKC